MEKAVFLDKDGTLIKDVPYNVDPEKIELYPEAYSALLKLKSAGYKLIVISNQPGIALGYFKPQALNEVWERINLFLQDARIDAFYYCPHLKEGMIAEFSRKCECRKPQPGLFRKAAEEHNISLGESWMIGDILNDMEAGKKAGCRTILINNGNETEWYINEFRKPDYSVTNLEEAARHILKI